MAALVITSGTGDVQALTGVARVLGYSVRESAGSPAVATVVLRDGIAASDPPRVFIELAASTSETKKTPVIDFATGIYVDREAGSTELVLYLG